MKTTRYARPNPVDLGVVTNYHVFISTPRNHWLDPVVTNYYEYQEGKNEVRKKW